MPCGIERLLHALHQRDLVRRQLEGQERRLREADAVLAADRSFERHDAFEEYALGLVRAAHLVVVTGRNHDVDVDVAVAGVPEARNPQRERATATRRRARTAPGCAPSARRRRG